MPVEIIHELAPNARHPQRLRVRCPYALTKRQARALAKELDSLDGISGASVNHHTANALFYANTAAQRRQALAHIGQGFQPLQHRHITAEEVEELLTGQKPAGMFIALGRFFLLRPLLPPVLRAIVSAASALPFLIQGAAAIAKGRLTVEALDGAALLVSLLMRDFRTVGMLTTMLVTGEALEAWTRHASLTSLGERLALHVDTVWKVDANGTETSVPLASIVDGDLIVVRDGSSIPVDGIVESGEALVNQAAITGEPLPAARERGGAVFAGAIVEAGALVIRATHVGKSTRLNQLVSFIEQSESRKSALEARYARLADKAVPFTFAVAGLVLLLTGNLMRAASALLVDYSCAIKLATPLAVLSAMRSAAKNGIAIKGGKYLEAISEADTLVFDKTGTLTNARPQVIDVLAAPGFERREILRLMACLEEHFPHPVARAVVNKAREEGLQHEEEHAQVKYVAAHGIASSLRGQRLRLGSRHYLEHDEHVDLAHFAADIARESALGHSLLFLAESGKAIGMAVIADPLRPEASAAVAAMRSLGFSRILMLTGDDERCARAIAQEAGITEYRANVLPTQKGEIIQALSAQGHKVMMVGDGINDGPALSAAAVGVAMGDGADLARAVANVLLAKPDLLGLPACRRLSVQALGRIRRNFQAAIGLNTLYMAGAAFLGISPVISAALHNLTTLGLALNAIRPYAGRDIHGRIQEQRGKTATHDAFAGGGANPGRQPGQGH